MRENGTFFVIDSGSTDGTIEFLKDQPRTAVHSIPSEEFGHGKTRNLGASMAKGDLVLMTVQDARPRSIQLDHSHGPCVGKQRTRWRLRKASRAQ